MKEKEQFVESVASYVVEVVAASAALPLGLKLGKKAAKATKKVLKKQTKKLRKVAKNVAALRDTEQHVSGSRGLEGAFAAFRPAQRQLHGAVDIGPLRR